MKRLLVGLALTLCSLGSACGSSEVESTTLETAAIVPMADPSQGVSERVYEEQVATDAALRKIEADRLARIAREQQAAQKAREATRAARAARASQPTQKHSEPTTAVSGDILDRLGQCESGGNPGRHSANGRYHGAFQFLISTWQSLGYSGDPHNHSYATQKEAAGRLIARSGWKSQFPACARKLGMA